VITEGQTVTAPAKLLFGRLLVVLCLGFVLSSVTAAEFDKADIDRKLSAIVSYRRGMDRGPLIAVKKLIRESEKRPEERQYIEHRLGVLLADATFDGKSFICKQLWFIGTADSVPAVAKLLLDEKTADMACYAIGRNPSPEAAEALRNALAKAGPNVQIRVINVLGDRRDTKSVEAIGKLVFGPEAQVAEAAVAALGKIGGAEAREVLVQARAKGGTDLRFAATDAYLRCAEALVAKGETQQATTIYRELSAKGEAAVVRSAAIKGLADIGGPHLANTVTEALHDRNRMVRTTAVGCVRTMKGRGVTERFAAELAKVSAGEQVLLIGALADRGDAAALPAITSAAKSADAEVRKAALQAVGKLGNASCVGLLVQAAQRGSSNEQKTAALNSLVDLQGAGVDNEIVKAVQVSPPEVRPQLIQVLFDRDAVGAVPALLGETSNPDPTVRKAAFKALGRLAGEKDLPSLVELLVKSRDDGSRRDAERALITACRKITDVSRRADVVLAALKGQEPVAVRCSLLRVLGHIANSRALEELSRAVQEQDPTVQDTAVRALANWPDPSAAEVLLGVYSRTPNKVHRLLALRGFARVLAMPAKGRPMEKTLDMCRQAVSRADNPREQKLVLSALANVADPAALGMVEPFLHDEVVRPEAAIAAIRIARTIMQSHPNEVKKAMSNLLTVLHDEDLRKQAQDLAALAERLEAGTPEAG
jgi:HEAT repeat protein